MHKEKRILLTSTFCSCVRFVTFLFSTDLDDTEDIKKEGRKKD